MGELQDRINTKLDEIRDALLGLADQALSVIETKVDELHSEVQRLQAENAADPANPSNSGETQS